jgi:peptidoglycan/LPS O-acetylase OafA/YrhL
MSSDHPEYNYRTLDAWRAIAALMVIGYHCSIKVLTPESIQALAPESGWWAKALHGGWAGVYIFFPVSGYCIFAAVSRRENATIGRFLLRRWRRIFPPYWASIVFTLAVAFGGSIFTRPPAYLNIGAGHWLSVLTLTQGFTSAQAAVNSVYWSLCFEEQFYLLVALTLLATARHRWHWLMVATILSGLYRFAQWPAALRWDGLFLENWLEFACGLAAFAWLRVPGRRAWATVVFAIALASAVGARSGTLALSLVVALAFIALAPFDAAMARTRLARGLMTLGVMSYSLYLVHVPVGIRVANLMVRWHSGFLIMFTLAIIASLVSGVAFYWIVERRFLQRTVPSLPPGSDRDVPKRASNSHTPASS